MNKIYIKVEEVDNGWIVYLNNNNLYEVPKYIYVAKTKKQLYDLLHHLSNEEIEKIMENTE